MNTQESFTSEEASDSAFLCPRRQYETEREGLLLLSGVKCPLVPFASSPWWAPDVSY